MTVRLAVLREILERLTSHPAMALIVVDDGGTIVLSSNTDWLGADLSIGRPIQQLGLELGADAPENWERVHAVHAGRGLLAWRVSLGQGYQLFSIHDGNTQGPQLSGGLAQQLKVFFDSSFDEIYVTDGQGVTIAVNAVCERLYNMPASALVGRNVVDLEREGVFYPSITLLVLKEKKPLTIVQTTSSGRKVIVTGNPVFDDKGRIIYVVSNSRDVTEILSLRQEVDRMHRLTTSMRDEIERLRKALPVGDEIIAVSAKMQEVLRIARQVARLDSTVLLLGESGVGKEVVARYIHEHSNRSRGPFVAISCPCIPEHLMESELFGYEEGAFTGARRRGKKGLIEAADGGTVFFDEIGDLPMSLQAKLLRVIQEQKLTRVGGIGTVEVSIRIISASNRDLAQMVGGGLFREDLYYRLNVVPIRIPPLRERPEDIGPLVVHFMGQFNKKYHTRKTLSKAAMQFLEEYGWPGNVREVANIVEQLAAVTQGNEIVLDDVRRVLAPKAASLPCISIDRLMPLRKAVEEVERQLILKAYSQTSSTYGAARELGVNQSTIVRKLQKYGITRLGGGLFGCGSASSPRTERQ